MKTLTYLLTTLLVIALIGFGLLQTSWVREKVIEKLTSQKGVKLSFRSLIGVIPFSMYMKNVQIQAGEQKFTFEELHIRPHLLSIFSGELGFTLIGKDFTVTISGRKRGDLHVRGSGKFLGNKVTFFSNLTILPGPKVVMPNFTLTGPREEKLYAAIEIGTKGAEASFTMEPLQVAYLQLENIQGNLQTKDFKEGTFSVNTTLFAEIWKIAFHWQLQEHFVRLDPIHASTSFADLTGDLTLTDTPSLDGKIALCIDDIYHLQPFYPEYAFFGGVGGEATFREKDGKQEATFCGNTYNLFIKNFYMKEMEVKATFPDLLTGFQGDFSLNGNNLRYQNYMVDKVNLTTSTEEENWPFKGSVSGTEKNPLDLFVSGFWNFRQGQIAVNLQECNGHILKQPFDMPRPVILGFAPHHLQISDLQINFASSKMLAEGHITPTDTTLRLILYHFPLNFLSINPWDIEVSGFASLEAALEQNLRKTDGHFHLDIESLQLQPLGGKEIKNATAIAKGKLDGQKLTFEGQLLIEGVHVIEGKGDIPIDIQLAQLSCTFPKYQNIDTEFIYDARAEEILDFINIGPHRLKGDVKCHLFCKQTYEHPAITGFCKLKNGTYENYYTGGRFVDLQANFVADRDRLTLESFNGKDEDKGTFSATGTFRIDPNTGYPYTVNLSFQDLICVDIDLVRATANGALEITGNRKSGLAQGNLQVVRADFTIPDKVPAFIPNLDPTYIREPQLKKENRTPTSIRKPYPMHLQLTIEANNDVFISGKGLSSEWGGNFKVGGTYDDILAKGDLQLHLGSYSFSGRDFSLVKGTLHFEETSGAIPYLSLSGQKETKGMMILADLKGPLNAPYLNLHSLPPHPLSAILSLLIFGQDISTISVAQAGQLAIAAASLAGEKTNILELARKGLGVDRLAVTTNVTKKGEETALQVGKYLTRGILFSISQGLDPSAGSIGVEIDLTHGFILEAQSFPQLEEGLFTIKWNKNY